MKETIEYYKIHFDDDALPGGWEYYRTYSDNRCDYWDLSKERWVYYGSWKRRISMLRAVEVSKLEILVILGAKVLEE